MAAALQRVRHLSRRGDRHIQVGSDDRVRIGKRGSPSLAAYLRICRQMVPNVHHEEVVLGEVSCPFSLCLHHRGQVVGGVTFRMLTAVAESGRERARLRLGGGAGRVR